MKRLRIGSVLEECPLMGSLRENSLIVYQGFWSERVAFHPETELYKAG
jgi:hypothetical protein